MNATLTVDDGGKITLPDPVRDRYQLRPDALVRIIETRNGILLVPLTNEPMSDELRRELEDWQSFSVVVRDSWDGALLSEVVVGNGDAASLAFHAHLGFGIEPGDARCSRGVPITTNYDGRGAVRENTKAWSR